MTVFYKKLRTQFILKLYDKYYQTRSDHENFEFSFFVEKDQIELVFDEQILKMKKELGKMLQIYEM